MTLQEYTRKVKDLVKGRAPVAYMARKMTKQWIEANWNKNLSPSYTAATILAEVAKTP